MYRTLFSKSLSYLEVIHVDAFHEVLRCLEQGFGILLRRSRGLLASPSLYMLIFTVVCLNP